MEKYYSHCGESMAVLLSDTFDREDFLYRKHTENETHFLVSSSTSVKKSGHTLSLFSEQRLHGLALRLRLRFDDPFTACIADFSAVFGFLLVIIDVDVVRGVKVV